LCAFISSLYLAHIYISRSLGQGQGQGHWSKKIIPA